jgi:5-methylthioadenosine/S-adenosylhomocysteine deaminase
MSLAVTGAVLPSGDPVSLRADGGSIAAVGPDVTAQPGDEVLDGAGHVLLPGLVNGHTHAAMTLFRGFAGDLALLDWLEQHIWPAEARLDAEDVYWGTRLACLEMIRTGTVRFWDMYWQPGAVARAVTDAGIRAMVGLPLIDGLDPSKSTGLRADALRFLDELADADPRVGPCLTPHGIYTVSPESLAWVAEEAATRDVPVHLHFLEIEDEVTGCVERTGTRPGPYLEGLGLLTPRTVLAHGVWMEDAELELVASHGTTVVTNPSSNLKLAVGRVFPYRRVRAAGIPVGLGTDGASSNNGLDLLQDVKLLSLLQKHAYDDPRVLPAVEAWDVVTGSLAPALGGAPELAVGAPADFLLVRADRPEVAPGHLVANLVYAASGQVVDTTVVAGRVLMRAGRIDGAAEVVAKARERAERLGVV